MERRRAAAAAAAAAEMAEMADAAQRQHRQRAGRAVVAAGLGLTLFGGSAAVIYRAADESRTGTLPDTQLALTTPLSAPRKPAARSAAALTDVPPSTSTVPPSTSQESAAAPQLPQPEPGGGQPERAPRSSPSGQPIAGSAAARPAVTVPATDAVMARNTVMQDAPPVTRMETPPITATPLASAPGDVADVPPPPAAPVSEERPRAVPPLVPGPDAPPPAATSAAAPTPASAPAPDEASRVRSVLSQYQVAYSQLNARAAQAIWPGVDGRSLARAFQSLESQRVSLGQCALAIDGGTARADCDGSATWTPQDRRRHAHGSPPLEVRASKHRWHLADRHSRRTQSLIVGNS